MKKLALFLLTLLFAALVFGIVMLDQKHFQTDKKLVTPILIDSKSIGLNQWFPKDVLASDSNIEITAKSAFFVDTSSGQVLFSKNPNQRLPIASLVKIMTVLIALEHRDLTDQFTVSSKASSMEPDKMQLIAGENLTLKELIYGIFLISANDAAETIAENTVNDRAEFIKLMNLKAFQLGMKNTFYANPTGLDEDNNNSYSSAYDLSLLSRYLIKHYPQVVDFSSTEHILLPQTKDHQDYDMYSGINLLTTYPGVVGFKTGFTPEAGLTLVTLARKNGHEVLGVILGSEDRRDEAKALLDFSFNHLSP